MSRAVGEPFFDKLINGELSIILEAVHNDTTLNMELRGSEVKIYYRGRLLSTIKEHDDSRVLCNDAYLKHHISGNSLNITPSPQYFVGNLALYKAPIDYYLANVKSYLEEQIKQQLVLENNVYRSSSGKTGDYFIIDTEYAFEDDITIDARFDAIALRWPSTISSRRVKKHLGLSFLELKYNDSAKTGDAGIRKHIDDFLTFVKREEYYDMCKDMEEVFVQKCKLGLIPAYNQAGSVNNISIDYEKSDLIFILANSDPDSENMVKEWETIKNKYTESELNNVFIGQASNFGYCLFRYGNQGEKDMYVRIKDYFD